MARIRKGDMVEVIAGNDRGKRGRVLRVIPDKGKLVVQGINLRWKHMRKTQQTPQGGRMRREVPIQTSNVMFFDEGAAIRSRLGSREEGGKKIRVLRRSGTPVGAAAPVEKKKKTAKKKKAKKAEAAEKES